MPIERRSDRYRCSLLCALPLSPLSHPILSLFTNLYLQSIQIFCMRDQLKWARLAGLSLRKIVFGRMQQRAIPVYALRPLLLLPCHMRLFLVGFALFVDPLIYRCGSISKNTLKANDRPNNNDNISILPDLKRCNRSNAIFRYNKRCVTSDRKRRCERGREGGNPY